MEHARQLMRQMIAAGLCLGLSGVALANEDKITQGFKSYDAMGCMLLRECKEDVDEVFTLLDISNEYPNTEAYTQHSEEFNTMLMTLNQIGVKVFLADSKYFPRTHRGVYHTVSNNFYLNRDWMGDPGTLMMLMRHEGWHAAQDCMAGTIDNSMIAIIMPEDEVPMLWRVMAERTYPENAVPWEAEAQWAGRTEHMTMKALQACAKGEMWTVYEPTPMTREWLEINGYIK
jgi:hypothetical protein|tara:strand:+ start:19396 stop:20085 length:690 start_codon:yes stop_codon:yes gene_type:complete